MANEVSHGNNADLKVASILNSFVHFLLADRSDIRSTVLQVSPPNDRGSLAVKIPQVLFDDIMAAPGESTAVNPTALGDGAATVTAARQALRYDMSDEFFLSGASVTPEMLAQGIVDGYIRRAAALIGAVINGFSDTAGTSGAALVVSDIYDAHFELQKNLLDGEPVSCVLTPKQFTDFQSSLRGEGGAMQWVPATADMLGIKPMGYVGSWNGVDFYKNAQLANDGTDDFGAMYARSAVAMAQFTVGAIRSLLPPNGFMDTARDEQVVWVEKNRTSESGLTKYVGHAIAGVILNEDARGVTIQTVD